MKLLKKFIIIIIILTGVCFPCFSQNMLQNASFEESKIKQGMSGILDGWNVRDADGVVRWHSISTEKSQDGHRSAMIDIPESKNGTCYFTPSSIQVKGGKNYRLTFYALYPEAKAGASARAVITRLNAEKKFDGMDGIKSINIKPVPDWEKYTMEYQMPINNNNYYINIRLSLEGSGKIWFDNISIEELAAQQAIVEFYPGSASDEKVIYAIRGEACQLLAYLFIAGDHQNIVLRLDAPVNFPLLDAVPFYYSKQSKTLPFTKHVQGNRVEYNIPLNKAAILPMSRVTGGLSTGEALLFKTPAEFVQSDLNWSLWRGNEKLSAGNLKIQGLTDPAPNAALPKRFTISSWYSPLLNFLNDKTALEQWLDVMARSGVSGGSINNSLSPRNQALLEKRNWDNNRTFWLEVPNHCLTGMSNSPQYEQFIKTNLKFSGNFDKKMLVWNFEPDLQKDYYHDCPACRQAFEKFSGKSVAGLKDSEAIEAKFPEQYLQFRCKQFQDVIKKYGQWCKENNCLSGLVTFSLPNGLNETALHRLKKLHGDVRSYANYVDYYMPMAYFKPDQFWSNLAAIKKYYQGKVIPVITSDERHNQTTYPYSLINSPEYVRSELLSIAAYGYRQTFLFYGFYVFDGRHILAQRQAMREIAMFEDYLFNGVDASSLLQLKTQGNMLQGVAKKYEEKYLLVLFNLDTAQPRTVALSLLPGKGEFSLTEPVAKRFFTNKAGSKSLKANDLNNLSFTLPPGDVRFFILSAPENGNYGGWQSTVLESAATAVTKQWTVLNEGLWKCTAAGTDEKTAEKITIMNGESIAEVLTADGGVISRLTGTAARNIAMYKEEGQGGFFRDLFWMPQAANWADDCRQPYQIKNIRVAGGNLEMMLERKLRYPLLTGLVICKTYTFTPDIKSLKNKTTIRNEGSSSKSITFWSHNRPALELKTVKFKVSDAETMAPAMDPNIYVPADRISGILTVEDQGTPRFSMIWPKTLLDKLYFWVGGDNPSVEGIFKPVTLEPGQAWSAEISLKIKQ